MTTVSLASNNGLVYCKGHIFFRKIYLLGIYMTEISATCDQILNNHSPSWGGCSRQHSRLLKMKNIWSRYVPIERSPNAGNFSGRYNVILCICECKMCKWLCGTGLNEPHLQPPPKKMKLTLCQSSSSVIKILGATRHVTDALEVAAILKFNPVTSHFFFAKLHESIRCAVFK